MTQTIVDIVTVSQQKLFELQIYTYLKLPGYTYVASDGNRLESSTSIIGGPHRFDNRLIIEMRTLVK